MLYRMCGIAGVDHADDHYDLYQTNEGQPLASDHRPTMLTSATKRTGPPDVQR